MLVFGLGCVPCMKSLDAYGQGYTRLSSGLHGVLLRRNQNRNTGFVYREIQREHLESGIFPQLKCMYYADNGTWWLVN